MTFELQVGDRYEWSRPGATAVAQVTSFFTNPDGVEGVWIELSGVADGKTVKSLQWGYSLDEVVELLERNAAVKVEGGVA